MSASPPHSSKPESQIQRNTRGLEGGRRKGPEFWTYVGGGADFCPVWENGVDHAGDPFDPVGFRWDTYGKLEFKGIPDVSAADLPVVAFTLPAEYAPTKRLVLPAHMLRDGELRAARYEVNSDGEVRIGSLGVSLYCKVFADAGALDGGLPDSATVVSTGDGKFHEIADADMGGMNLVRVFAGVSTVSSSGAVTVQVRNVTQSADMLSTALTIDSGEKSSLTAATPAVIDTANDDVAAGDEIRIDVDGAGTGAKGLLVKLWFAYPVS